MGISERKERQKAELREMILAAARRIFVEEGSQALTMRRIADEIEYSPGTIYLYFSSREEIAIHLVREGFAKLLETVTPALGIIDPVDRLRAIAAAYVAFGLADPATYRLIFMDNAKYVYAGLGPPGEAGVGNAGQRVFDGLAAAIGEAVAGGQFAPIEPEAGAQAVWAALHGVISLHVTCPLMIADARSVAALVTATVLAGLAARAPCIGTASSGFDDGDG